jgi:KDO2-lipid IV(A) lauroyltransferase
MALFAITARVPIVPAIFRREGWTRQGFDRLPSILPDPSLSKEDDARRITALVTAQVDEAIRRRPEQWFWYNKRWILKPVAEAVSAHPAPSL